MDFLCRRDAGAPINHPEPTPMTRFTRIALTGAILLAGAGAALAQPAQDDARSEPLVING